MLQAISPDYLFYKIGEKGTDSVFKRAFSVLIPPLILSVHENRCYRKNNCTVWQNKCWNMYI